MRRPNKKLNTLTQNNFPVFLVGPFNLLLLWSHLGKVTSFILHTGWLAAVLIYSMSSWFLTPFLPCYWNISQRHFYNYRVSDYLKQLYYYVYKQSLTNLPKGYRRYGKFTGIGPLSIWFRLSSLSHSSPQSAATPHLSSWPPSQTTRSPNTIKITTLKTPHSLYQVSPK